MPFTVREFAEAAAAQGLTRERFHEVLAGMGIDSYASAPDTYITEQQASIPLQEHEGARAFEPPVRTVSASPLTKAMRTDVTLGPSLLPPEEPARHRTTEDSARLTQDASELRTNLVPFGAQEPTPERAPPTLSAATAPHRSEPDPRLMRGQVTWDEFIGGGPPLSLDHPNRFDVPGDPVLSYDQNLAAIKEARQTELPGGMGEASLEELESAFGVPPGDDRIRFLHNTSNPALKLAYAKQQARSAGWSPGKALMSRTHAVLGRWGELAGIAPAVLASGSLRGVAAMFPEKWDSDEDFLGMPASDRRNWRGFWERQTIDILDAVEGTLQDAVQRSGDHTLLHNARENVYDSIIEVDDLIGQLALGSGVPAEYWKKAPPESVTTEVAERLGYDPAAFWNQFAHQHQVLSEQASNMWTEMGIGQVALLGALIRNPTAVAEAYPLAVAGLGLPAVGPATRAVGAVKAGAKATAKAAGTGAKAVGGKILDAAAKAYKDQPVLVSTVDMVKNTRPAEAFVSGAKRAGAGARRFAEGAKGAAAKAGTAGAETWNLAKRWLVDATQQADPAAQKASVEMMRVADQVEEGITGIGRTLQREYVDPRATVVGVPERGPTHGQPGAYRELAPDIGADEAAIRARAEDVAPSATIRPERAQPYRSEPYGSPTPAEPYTAMPVSGQVPGRMVREPVVVEPPPVEVAPHRGPPRIVEPPRLTHMDAPEQVGLDPGVGLGRGVGLGEFDPAPRAKQTYPPTEMPSTAPSLMGGRRSRAQEAVAEMQEALEAGRARGRDAGFTLPGVTERVTGPIGRRSYRSTRQRDSGGKFSADPEKWTKNPMVAYREYTKERFGYQETPDLGPPQVLPEVAATRAAMKERRAQGRPPDAIPDHRALVEIGDPIAAEPLPNNLRLGWDGVRLPSTSLGYEFPRTLYRVDGDTISPMVEPVGALDKSGKPVHGRRITEDVSIEPRHGNASAKTREVLDEAAELFGSREGVANVITRQDVYDAWNSAVDPAAANRLQLGIVRKPTAEAAAREMLKRQGRLEKLSEGESKKLISETSKNIESILEDASKGKVEDVGLVFTDKFGKPDRINVVPDIMEPTILSDQAFQNAVTKLAIGANFDRLAIHASQRVRQQTMADALLDWHPLLSPVMREGWMYPGKDGWKLTTEEVAALRKKAMSDVPAVADEARFFVDRYNKRRELPLVSRHDTSQVLKEFERIELESGATVSPWLKERVKRLVTVSPDWLDMTRLADSVKPHQRGIREIKTPLIGKGMEGPIAGTPTLAVYDGLQSAMHRVAKDRQLYGPSAELGLSATPLIGKHLQNLPYAREAGELADAYISYYKAGRVAANPTSWVAALVSNGVLATYATGNVMAPLKAVNASLDIMRWRRGQKTTYPRELWEDMVQTGMLDTGFTKDLIGRNKAPSADVPLVKMLKEAPVVGGAVEGYGAHFGAMTRAFDYIDNGYKALEGMGRVMKRNYEWDRLMGVGDWVDVSATKGKTQRLTKLEPKKGMSDAALNGVRLTKKQKRMKFMQDAMQPALNKYVNFKDLGLLAREKRQSKLYDMVGSPFAGWAQGTRTIPGMQKGVLWEFLAGPTVRGATNSKRVMAHRMAEQLEHSLRMAGVSGALISQVSDDERAMRKTGWSIGSPEMMTFTQSESSPYSFNVWSVPSGNVLENADALLRMAQSGQYALAEMLGLLNRDGTVDVLGYDERHNVLLFSDEDIAQLPPDAAERVRAAKRLWTERAEGGGADLGTAFDLALLGGNALASSWISLTSMPESKQEASPGLVDALAKGMLQFVFTGGVEKAIKAGAEWRAGQLLESSPDPRREAQLEALGALQLSLYSGQEGLESDDPVFIALERVYQAALSTGGAIDQELKDSVAANLSEIDRLRFFAGMDRAEQYADGVGFPLGEVKRDLVSLMLKHMWKAPSMQLMLGKGGKVRRKIFDRVKGRLIESMTKRFGTKTRALGLELAELDAITSALDSPYERERERARSVIADRGDTEAGVRARADRTHQDLVRLEAERDNVTDMVSHQYDMIRDSMEGRIVAEHELYTDMKSLSDPSGAGEEFRSGVLGAPFDPKRRTPLGTKLIATKEEMRRRDIERRRAAAKEKMRQ